MEKHLIRVGHSYALVIDKPIRRILGLADQTALRVTTDGVRIIAEPVRDPEGSDPARSPAMGPAPGPMPVPLELRRISGLKTFDALLKREMSQPLFERLNGGRMFAFQVAVDIGSKSDPQLSAKIDRCEACLRELEAGRTWDEAIAAALERVPRPMA